MAIKSRDNQTFLSLYYEPNVVEVATGGTSHPQAEESWQGETKRLGQVATPEPVAIIMAKWVMSAKPRSVLDPAAGLGGLLAACHRFDARAQLVGVERDARTLKLAKSSAPRGAKMILTDYLKSEGGVFDGIIANPPYVKAQRLDYTEADWRFFEERVGTKLDRLTNLYALFLLRIWEDLAAGGRAAVILPAEFLNANFGCEIKERIVRVMRPVALLVFAPSLNIFPGSLTTSALVFLEKGRLPDSPSMAKQIASVEEADAFVTDLLAGRAGHRNHRCFEIGRLNPSEKWLNLLFKTDGIDDSTFFTRRVGDYFDCKRGIATGANDFFCLNRSELRRHHLAQAHVEPCVTKAVDAEGLVFTREEFDALINNDRRCFLLHPSRIGPELTQYLKIGEKHGIHERHLPSHRPVWYLPESRAAADIWAAVFSRASVKFILNVSGARNLTCFHGLYAKAGFETLPPLMTVFLNSSGGRRAFSQVNRFYGDGLNKLEPKDVEAMACPKMPRLSTTEAGELTAILRGLENLAPDERTAELDDLGSSYFGSSPTAGKPASQPRARDQSGRL